MSTVGPLATVANTILKFIFDEDGLNEVRKRRALSQKKKECLRAKERGDWVELRRLALEYERMSNSP